MNRFLLCAFLVGCRMAPDGPIEDPAARHRVETLEQRARELDDRTLLIEAKLEELDRCLTMKMTYVQDLFQLRVGVQTCVAVMRNVRGLTP